MIKRLQPAVVVCVCCCYYFLFRGSRAEATNTTAATAIDTGCFFQRVLRFWIRHIANMFRHAITSSLTTSLKSGRNGRLVPRVRPGLPVFSRAGVSLMWITLTDGTGWERILCLNTVCRVGCSRRAGNGAEARLAVERRQRRQRYMVGGGDGGVKTGGKLRPPRGCRSAVPVRAVSVRRPDRGSRCETPPSSASW